MVHTRSRRASVLVLLAVVGFVVGLALPASAEVISDTSTTVILPCGTQDQPCVQAIQEWQYLALMLFAGTQLILALVTFWRREAGVSRA